MNRKERRRLTKNGLSDRDINYVEKHQIADYLDEIREKAYKQGRKDAIEIIFTMTAYTLNYKLNLGKKRLPEIMEKIYENIDAYRTGHLTAEDYQTIKKLLWKKFNIGIK